MQQCVERGCRRGCRRPGARPSRPACRRRGWPRPRARSASGIACGRSYASPAPAADGLSIDALAAPHLPLTRLRAPRRPCTRSAASTSCSRLRECSGSRRASAWSSLRPASSGGMMVSARRLVALRGAGALGGCAVIPEHDGTHDARSVAGLAWALLLSAACLAGAAAPPARAYDETRDWSAQRLYSEAKSAMLERRWTTAVKLLREARGALSVRPLRPAGAARDRLRLLPRQRARPAVAACDRFIKLLSRPSERRLRLLPEGRRELLRRPEHPQRSSRRRT